MSEQNPQPIPPNFYPPDPGEVLLIDKPLGWTSFDVVRKLKFGGKFQKIGHAGTLDPLATGLLICCTGKMTKQIDSYQAQEKEYTGTLVLGKTTPSVDLETPFDAVDYPTDHITPELLAQAAQRLTGAIEQIPPIYSAIWVDGQRAYRQARRGVAIEMKARPVQVYAFDLDTSRFPEIDFRIVCSKGTYVRSLVRDLGEGVQSGAHMSALRRTRIGNFRVEDALTIEDFIAQRGGARRGDAKALEPDTAEDF
ncbi:MAG: tRNA pseudouridine(55) synthase TruB [Cytophagaceae bacterium]|nr:tRNA pseudouridine(55) synthase TruB [Cytophagaceae bacterium]